MKRYLTILILTFFYCTLSAQEWSCDSISKSIAIFNSFSSEGNKKWAEHLTHYFSLNRDGEIELNYVLNCTDSIERIELVALSEGWLGTVFSNPKSLIQVSNKDQLVCRGELGQVAFDQKFIGAARILAPIEIVILYKDNRVRLSLLTRSYRMAYANIGRLESDVVSIAETFPFNKQSDHKEAYAMALINSYSKLLDIANGFLIYLNKHTTDSKTEVPEW
jgi:hypothetical protein